jgi:threonine dehydratase
MENLVHKLVPQPAQALLSLADVHAAAGRIMGKVVRTPRCIARP